MLIWAVVAGISGFWTSGSGLCDGFQASQALRRVKGSCRDLCWLKAQKLIVCHAEKPRDTTKPQEHDSKPRIPEVMLTADATHVPHVHSHGSPNAEHHRFVRPVYSSAHSIRCSVISCRWWEPGSWRMLLWGVAGTKHHAVLIKLEDCGP